MRSAIAATLFLLAGPALGVVGGQTPQVQVQVYKSPTCGCCSNWVTHMRSHGFTVTATDVEDVNPIKASKGLPPKLASCHTAVVGGYVIEGHVPAADVQRLLKERPRIAGLAVPGMPIGSPGMEGRNPEAYDVLSFDANGKVAVFASHKP